MISEHSAHSTPHTYLLLLISMLWHRQAIFGSNGDKLSSSAEGRIRTQDLRYLFTSRLNACWQTDWAIVDQAKNLNSTAHTYIHTYIHICWFNFDALAQGNAYKPTYIHTYIHTYIFVVVNFDALAQASDIQIERRQFVFLCWRQDLNPGPQTPNRQQTECSLTNRLSYRGSS